MKGALLPDQPAGCPWCHSPPGVLYNEFPILSPSSSCAYLYQISLPILTLKTFGNAVHRELKAGPLAHHLQGAATSLLYNGRPHGAHIFSQLEPVIAF